jgi:plasmid stabilization system protein ParE
LAVATNEREKAIIEARLDEYDQNPETDSSWEEAKARVLAGLHSNELQPAKAEWYDQCQPGLGEKFVREVDQAIARVVKNPLAFPVILKRHEMRRALTKRFPYRIFVSLKRDALVVHAVFHGHRSDRHWKDRS